MSKSGRSLMIALLSVSIFAAGPVEAARLGGGKSTGMKRSVTTQSAPQRQAQQTPPQQQTAPQTAQPQQSGPGWGGVAAGVAAGAATGYLVSKAMEPNGVAASQPAVAPQQRSSGIPWGTILLLGGIGLLGAMWLSRRNAARSAPVPAGMASSPAGLQQQDSQKVYRVGEGMTTAAPAAMQSGRLPDGTETAAFLRQARATFQHVQSLNSPDQLEEVRKYLTPGLFDDLKSEIAANREVAEFHNLQADLLDASNEDGRLVASVRFSGQVSESLNSPAVPFAEVWHFVRPSDNDPRWLLAGIEQL
ncbi:Predicted lipid-binding transport protein, Tim44 family [Formivibrio citricus]|uniref:Predicted lipid-binding transport protein, Tim44 family n=1 Tax=Formivibrio citricus TaxID=83765 RepID=A0A1I5BJH4_9NEIS|nr:Tim44-like domain-containing protein [Formivibrio citricus]SFN74739.1 Predicted lipid-binding transport protein, Tim44 family [Formivibrio citricus]